MPEPRNEGTERHTKRCACDNGQGYQFVLFDTLNRFYVAEERSDLLERFPRERAPWNAVTHMYEIGLAPRHQQHPDHDLAAELARGFWASLPYLDDELILSILRRSRELSGNAAEELGEIAKTESFRQALGRIACGYDGGQLDEK